VEDLAPPLAGELSATLTEGPSGAVRHVTELSMSAGLSLGIDFGTTNTVLALARADGPAELLRFRAPGGEITAFRSALGFQAPHERARERVVT